MGDFFVWTKNTINEGKINFLINNVVIIHHEN